jgi:nucleotide-binding universal stress UspA family protein
MVKYNRLLVAVDGSETGLHALRESFKLSSSWVTVVAVAPFYEGDLRMVGLAHPQVQMMEPCNTALESAQQMADEAGAVIQTACAVGPPHERIVELAAAGSRDLIVMGAKGLSFIERALVGSVTRRVIGYTEKDVLVVPLQAQVGWDKILLATDASPSSLGAKERALDLAQAYGSELLVVAVMELSAQLYWHAAVAAELRGMLQQHVEEIVAQAQSRNILVSGQVLEGTPYKTITAQAAQEKINLIVMGSHGHTGLKRLLMGSVTEKVIGHAACPVLVVKG